MPNKKEKSPKMFNTVTLFTEYAMKYDVFINRPNINSTHNS
jgi:hypothetical protein